MQCCVGSVSGQLAGEVWFMAVLQRSFLVKSGTGQCLYASGWFNMVQGSVSGQMSGAVYGCISGQLSNAVRCRAVQFVRAAC